MDLSSFAIGMALLIACILPFYLMSAKNKRREQEQLQDLLKLAEESGCQITQHDLWNNSLIGIDSTANILFFLRKVNGQAASEKVNLAQVQHCRVEDVSRTITSKDGNYSKTDQSGLVLTYRDKGRKETKLEFYNVEYDSLTMQGELLLAKKWAGIIAQAISANNKL
ncbi:hypothetical protein [Rufibacter roseus]|uniref:DUF4446 family protein n=1 Tax=Rufibacter roseus TaxID=1567108 RepID=A0ABW2DJ83_9BACT|nr:hypothetical protein [Rufibacter roseus]